MVAFVIVQYSTSDVSEVRGVRLTRQDAVEYRAQLEAKATPGLWFNIQTYETDPSKPASQ